MKKLFLLLIVCAIAFSFSSDNDRSLATVQEQQGIKIFILSKPVTESVFLGETKISGIVRSTKGDYLLSLLVKKTREKFPSANGLIVSDLSFEKADAIMFK